MVLGWARLVLVWWRARSPFLQILYACYPSLSVCDHLGEEVGEACPAELRIAAAVEVSVVDGLAVRWDAESGC